MSTQDKLKQLKASETANAVKAMAWAMMNPDSRARREAEKMMGTRFEDMTPEQRVLAAAALTAFNGIW